MISLGGLCEVAYQLRRFSRSERAYPFDWWILPLAGLPALLDAGAQAAFETHQLQHVAEYDGLPALYSNLARSIHLHEFPHGDAGLDLPLDQVSARLMQKYAALQQRLASDCAAGRTLFVRRFLDGNDPATPADLLPWVDALSTRLARIAPDHRLLLVGYPPLPERPLVLQAAPPRLRGPRGLGSNPGWTLLLRGLGIRLAQRARGAHERVEHGDLFATFAPGERPRGLLDTLFRRGTRD